MGSCVCMEEMLQDEGREVDGEQVIQGPVGPGAMPGFWSV